MIIFAATLVCLIAFTFLREKINMLDTGVIALGVAVPLIGCLIIRLGGSLDTAVLFVSITGQILVAAFAGLTGGLHSPIMVWLLGFIVWTATYRSRTVATAVSAVTAALILLLFILHHLDRLPVSSIQPGSLTLTFFITHISVAVMLAWVVAGLVQRWQRSRERIRENVRLLESANRHKSEFLSHMSHELRTPLNAVLGFAQLMLTRGDNLTAEARYSNLQHIYNAGRHLADMTDDLLDLVQIDEGRLRLQPEAVEPSLLMREILPLLRFEAEKYDVAMLIVEEAPATIWVDQKRFRQVLLNLASNAVRYNREGGRVELGATLKGSKHVRIFVRDTGYGIKPEEYEMIFERFGRLKSRTDRVDGVGIGLPLSKSLAEEMGGELGFDSTPGEGSTFWVDFPVHEEVPET